MPDIDAWAGNEFPLGSWLDDIHASVDTARILADKGLEQPTAIVPDRGRRDSTGRHASTWLQGTSHCRGHRHSTRG